MSARLLPALLLLLSMTTLASPAKADSVVLGGGCFWCLDASYKLLPGVTHVTCGYSGGTVAHPTYEMVCTEETGHAEVVKVDFDPKVTSLEKVLAYFWHVHDPTQVGGQGNDMGSQYRSIILYADPAQKLAAEQ
jgi:peptide-methionine (S)-S-oxide reductase